MSSAYREMLHSISVVMSLMYMRKSKGPKIEPCGTPAEMRYMSDDWPSIVTRIFLLVK